MFKRVLMGIATFLVITIFLLYGLQIPVIVEDREKLANVSLVQLQSLTVGLRIGW